MIACLLCMKKKTNQIRLCSKKGMELKCSDIIAKHFWFKPSAEKNSQTRICLICWRIVRDFHNFYTSVAEIHNFLDCDNLDPGISGRESSNVHQLPTYVKPKESANDQCTVTDIKIEKNYVQTTQEIKVSAAEEIVSRRALRAARRGRRKKKDEDLNKKETCLPKMDDSEIELPLSMLLQNIKTSSNPKEHGQPDEIFCDISKEEELYQPQNETSNCEILAKGEPLIEEQFVNMIYDNNAPSIPEDFESDGSSDIEPPERFAEIIAPRHSGKSKKKRTRIRPSVPYRRMTKEEIEKKHLQQNEYDEIISRFFDNFPCPICDLLVCTFGEMRKHFNTEHNGIAPSVTCCGRRFPMRKTLADHVSVHLDPEYFKCLHCDQCFQDRLSLKNHQKIHNTIPEEKQTFCCHLCSKQLSSKGSLKEHLAIKHKPKSEYEFSCIECKSKFPTKGILKKHMQKSHRPGGVVICEKCGKSMQSKGALRYHIQNEHSNTPRIKPARVECPICKTTLCDEYSLKHHILSIHEEAEKGGEYRCQICGYLSVNARALKRHIAYNHEVERKFKCTMCDKAFKRSDTLKEHITTHTGEGRHTCPECQMTFACKANFHKHKQRRHGHKPVKRNLIGLAEKKRQKTVATSVEEQATN